MCVTGTFPIHCVTTERQHITPPSPTRYFHFTGVNLHLTVVYMLHASTQPPKYVLTSITVNFNFSILRDALQSYTAFYV